MPCSANPSTSLGASGSTMTSTPRMTSQGLGLQVAEPSRRVSGNFQNRAAADFKLQRVSWRDHFLGLCIQVASFLTLPLHQPACVVDLVQPAQVHMRRLLQCD